MSLEDILARAPVPAPPDPPAKRGGFVPGLSPLELQTERARAVADRLGWLYERLVRVHEAQGGVPATVTPDAEWTRSNTTLRLAQVITRQERYVHAMDILTDSLFPDIP